MSPVSLGGSGDRAGSGLAPPNTQRGAECVLRPSRGRPRPSTPSVSICSLRTCSLTVSSRTVSLLFRTLHRDRFRGHDGALLVQRHLVLFRTDLRDGRTARSLTSVIGSCSTRTSSRDTGTLTCCSSVTTYLRRRAARSRAVRFRRAWLPDAERSGCRRVPCRSGACQALLLGLIAHPQWAIESAPGVKPDNPAVRSTTATH